MVSTHCAPRKQARRGIDPARTFSMELRGKRVLVIGGAGLIGSHTVDALTREDVREIVIYDNFTRGTSGNLASALKDARVRVFEAGGDILHTDVLEAAMKGVD